MSLHTDLDIYKTAEAFFVLMLALQKHVPREFRLVVGQRVAGLAADILLQVARANKAATPTTRMERLDVLAEHIEAVTVLLRNGRRVRAVQRGQWSETLALTDALGKQCTGWRKETRRRAGLQDEPDATTGRTHTPPGDLFAAAPAA
ncbi:MAG: four helix bundle protein [Ramlibacter sp.]